MSPEQTDVAKVWPTRSLENESPEQQEGSKENVGAPGAERTGSFKKAVVGRCAE